jgi:hypothetical protein
MWEDVFVLNKNVQYGSNFFWNGITGPLFHWAIPFS